MTGQEEKQAPRSFNTSSHLEKDRAYEETSPKEKPRQDATVHKNNLQAATTEICRGGLPDS